MPIRVVIADDQALVRAGIRSLLSADHTIDVVGEAGNGIEAVQLARELSPDLILMDINMPGLNGFEATARLCEELPGTKVIVISQHDDEVTARRAVKAGAKGYVLKAGPVEELFAAIRAVCRGQSYFVSPIGDYLATWAAGGPAAPDLLARLSLRQREVLQLIAEGRSTKEIAYLLKLSGSTVDTHRTELMRRLDLHDVASLVRFAIREGLTRVQGPIE